MLQRFLSDRNFFQLLLSYDADLAEQARATNCRYCGKRLHQAHYQRKPRGGPCPLDEEYNCRFSFCCYDCRKRLTPCSLRFLGRKVYFGAVMVLISAMLGDASPRRRRRLHEICGADERTLGRWRTWWAETFSRTDTWRILSARFSLVWTSGMAIPRQLLQKLAASSLQETLQGVLRLLLPLAGGP
jgi:hypothetical protein